MSIQPTFFEIREVGKTFKGTKKQYIWRFKLETKEYTIELFTSMLSGKKKILQNGQQIFFDSKFKNAFQFPFTIGKNLLNIVQHGDKYELRINNQSFSHLWDNEKTKRAFNYENKEAHDPYQAKDYGEHYKTSTQATSRDPADIHRQQRPPMRSEYDEHHQSTAHVQKQPAQQQERIARKEPQQPKKQQDVEYNAYDFSTGFDHGFDKFSTYAQNPQGEVEHEPKKIASAKQKKESDFFDESAFNAKAQNPSAEFDFNFGGKNEANKAQSMNNIVDLDDLLGGSTHHVVPANEGQNALDFFNDNTFGNQPAQKQPPQQQANINDIFSMPAAQSNVQPQAAVNIFDGTPTVSVVQQQPQQPVQNVPQQEAEKPKFVPNLNSFYTNSNANQSQQAQIQLQQQMMMQQMMMNQQQQYNTQMNPQQQSMMGMGNNMGAYQQQQMQQQNYGMNNNGQDQSANQYGTQMAGQSYQQPQYNQQYQTSAPQQVNMGGFGATNTASVGANSGSTPFDLFS